MNQPPDANYRYWQQRGSVWPERYQERKLWQVFYHLQELYLLDYFLHSGPARILEFGCGYGRHLRNLLPVEGLEVFGHDQSPTMLGRMSDWADPAWMESHVTLGDPVGRLPYDDDFFDVVYTAEVLVHVRPEDLASVLEELIRVSRWQVLHLETAPGAELDPETHGGCWKHDLTAAHRALGHQVEELTQCYHMHLPSRVVLDPERPIYTMPPLMAERWAQCEVQLQPTIDRGRQAQTVMENKNDQLEQMRRRLRDDRVELKKLEQMQRNVRSRLEAMERERERLVQESDRRIADLERLEKEQAARISQLKEEAVLARSEAQRAARRLRSGSDQWERVLEEQRRKADWAQAQMDILHERLLELQDTHDVQRSHLVQVSAEKDSIAQRYASLLRTLDELAGWGER